jgi:hypothetical protein
MSTAPAAETAAMPSAVYAVATTRTCSAKQFFTIEGPHIEVNGTVSARTLAVSIRLVSNEPTSLEPRAWRAFVAVDGRPMIVSMQAGESVSVAFPGLRTGMHSVHYGVYRFDKLVQDEFFCREVRSP